MLIKLTARAHKKLISLNKTVSVAESCTGGLLSCLLTSLPSSSKYFIFGAITYSNEAKTKFLKIPREKIKKFGAVSEEVALLMAKNLRKIVNSDFSLSITGIAGPAGATAAKPVGTVFICLAYKKMAVCKKFSFKGSRQIIRKKSAEEALRLLCAHLSR